MSSLRIIRLDVKVAEELWKSTPSSIVGVGLAEVTNTTLQLTFTIGSAGSAREMGIDGDWTFNFTRQ